MWSSLAVVAIWLVATSSNTLGCRPGSIISKDCNTCICDDTRLWACTSRPCPRRKRDVTCSSEEMENPQMKCACVQKGYGSPEDKAQCLGHEVGKSGRFKRGPPTRVGVQHPRLCLKPKTYLKNCNTCRQPEELPPPREEERATTTTKSPSMPRVCLPRKDDYMKNCNTCRVKESQTNTNSMELGTTLGAKNMFPPP